MTYSNLKYLCKALLIGDNVLTNDNNEVLVLLSYAYDKIANETDALKLFTATASDEQILRQGPGGIYVRKPKLPENDSDELDIDDELCYVAARYICSFVSREKGGIHVNEAMTLIRAYNQKVQVFLENLAQDGTFEQYDSVDKFGKTTYTESNYQETTI